MRLAPVAIVLAAALLTGALGCSNGSSDPGDAGASDGASGDSALVGCQDDPRADTYAANLTKPGKAGLFQFVLVSATPAPPALNNNSWVVRVLDAHGNPLPNVSILSVSAYMPDHGHPSTATPMATTNADGSFTIAPLYLFMAGLWQITIAAQSGSQSDSVVFSFCVAG
jgi:hypothetical protein